MIRINKKLGNRIANLYLKPMRQQGCETARVFAVSQPRNLVNKHFCLQFVDTLPLQQIPEYLPQFIEMEQQ